MHLENSFNWQLPRIILKINMTKRLETAKIEKVSKKNSDREMDVEDVKVMFRDVFNREFPAEFYWDGKLLIYKRGDTTSIEEIGTERLTAEDFKHHFFKLFRGLLKNHKGDEEVQKAFFFPKFAKIMEKKVLCNVREHEERNFHGS